MSVSTRVNITIDQRRVEISRRYLSGETQLAIAQSLGVSRQLIVVDLKAIRRDWRSTTSQNYETGLNQELAKIDLLEQTALDAWERSTQKATRLMTRTRTIQLDESGKPGTITETTETTSSNAGDERFLARIAWCIEKRCKLLGYEGIGGPIDNLPPPQQQQTVIAMPGSAVQVNTVEKFTPEQLAALTVMAKVFPKGE